MFSDISTISVHFVEECEKASENLELLFFGELLNTCTKRAPGVMCLLGWLKNLEDLLWNRRRYLIS